MNGKSIAAVAGGLGLAFVSYCIYFDRKRRSDPNFRKKLIESKLSPSFYWSFRDELTKFVLERRNQQQARAEKDSSKVRIIKMPKVFQDWFKTNFYLVSKFGRWNRSADVLYERNSSRWAADGLGRYWKWCRAFGERCGRDCTQREPSQCSSINSTRSNIQTFGWKASRSQPSKKEFKNFLNYLIKFSFINNFLIN